MVNYPIYPRLSNMLLSYNATYAAIERSRLVSGWLHRQFVIFSAISHFHILFSKSNRRRLRRLFKFDNEISRMKSCVTLCRLGSVDRCCNRQPILNFHLCAETSLSLSLSSSFQVSCQWAKSIHFFISRKVETSLSDGNKKNIVYFRVGVSIAHNTKSKTSEIPSENCLSSSWTCKNVSCSYANWTAASSVNSHYFCFCVFFSFLSHF